MLRRCSLISLQVSQEVSAAAEWRNEAGAVVSAVGVAAGAVGAEEWLRFSCTAFYAVDCCVLLGTVVHREETLCLRWLTCKHD